MSEMKMSEVFSLPLQATYEKDYSDEYNHHICDSTGDILLPCIPDDVDQEFIVEAVNNHDRMVEEIAELKGLVDSLKKDRSSAISLMSKSWQHGAEDRPMILTSFVEMANKQFESLAKLNQEGEG